jgi:chromodomain-helicase-DNA-binding protein 1
VCRDCPAERRSIVWQAIIVDEAHCLKDHKSLLYQAVLSLKTASKILLTGTPIQNSQSELWSLLHFLHPDNPNIGDLETWLARFATLDRVRLEALTTLMASFLLRRSKATALKSLPPLDVSVVVSDGASLNTRSLRRGFLRRKW